MPDFSLVPVDHQPDFSDVSFIPVDHDPFSADDIIQQARAQLASQPQRMANGAGQSDVGVPANNAQVAESGESWDPDSENDDVHGPGQPNHSLVVPTFTQDKPVYNWTGFQPFGELKPATFTPTQRIGYLVSDALMGRGMQPYNANDLTSRVGSLLGLTPLGVVGSALNLFDAKRRDDLPGALAAAAGMIPGAKGVARGITEELHHAWPKYLGGAVKQELVALPKSLHREFHKRLDGDLPMWRGTAYYERLGPTERQQALQFLAAHTKNFDAEHGTKLYDALLKNGFPAP